MSKVIHTIKSKSLSLLSNLSSLLHRGQKSKDPYNNRLNFNPARLLRKTLGTSSANTRCSRTFQTPNQNNFNKYINNSKNLRLAGTISAIILLALSALTAYPIIKNSNLAEAAGQDSTTTLTMTTGKTSANVELLVTDSAGTFAKSTDDGLAEFKVTTNNGSGYNLTIKGQDSNYDKLTNSTTGT